MNLAGLLARAGHTHGDHPAIAVGETDYCSYRELARRTATLGGRFKDRLRLATGDRVAIVMQNCPQILEVIYGAWHAGLCVVPINAKLHEREFEYILENSAAKCCFVTRGFEATVGPLSDRLPTLERVVSVASPEYGAMLRGDPVPMSRVSPTAPAWLFYTSGTTGRPKGATLCHRNLLAMTLSYFVDVDAVSPGHSLFHAAPMSHGSGLYNSIYVAAAAKQVIPASGRFDPAEILDLIPRHREVSFFAAPTMVKRLVDHPDSGDADTRNLRTIVYGGGPMYVSDLKRAMAVFGNKLAQVYGQGETPMTITVLSKAQHADRTHPRHEARLASVGVAHTVVEVGVVDEADQALPAGEIGEVVVRGDSVMNGYWENPEATATSLRGGRLHTGDLGVLDEDGFLTLKDRSNDLIISGGVNIYPREVEEVLLLHDGVREVSVIGRPHEEWGEEVVAFVVKAEGEPSIETELDTLCLDHIARFKRPRAYLFVDHLPKNNYGKILKTELRQWLDQDRSS